MCRDFLESVQGIAASAIVPIGQRSVSTAGDTCPEGLHFRLQLLVFLVAFALVVSRRPDAIFNAQFFAEDGSVWYAQAYHLGWLHSLLLPYAGYFVTLPRLVAGLAFLFPLRFAPLVMNVVGIGIQALPVNVLLLERCSNWGTLPERAVYAAVYLGLPNTRGINASITNAQWHLALIACLLILARPSQNWRAFDCATILLFALTGPFCLLLLPIALVFWWKSRNSPRASVLLVLAFGALLQGVTIYETAAARHPGSLGASLESLVRILAGQVYLGALLGRNNLSYNASLVLLGLVAVSAIVALLYCLAFAGLEWRLYLGFCALLLGAALSSPQVVPEPTKWETLKRACDSQYWFFPMLGFAWSLIWCFRHTKSQSVQILSTAMLFFMCIGIARDWRYAAHPDLRFREYARELDNAPIGTEVSIPINPVASGVDWTMRITKR
jgi:hypothetical protein